jgi:rubrerythrin
MNATERIHLVTDSAVAEPDDLASSRRSLLGTGVLGAGVVGAARALGLPRQAGASAPGNVSESDRNLVTFAIGLELAARDLYSAAIDAGNTASPWRILREQHRSYAERLGGAIGVSANTADAGVFALLEASFTGDRPAGAAFDLENTAAATHIELLGALEDPALAAVVAAIAAMESRHAAYLAERSGRGDDFDALFTNPAAPLAPEASS